jgi:CheY-like chemotaxis protein
MPISSVLVVDDDPISLALLRLTFEDAGYLVATAHDAREALARATRTRPAAIVVQLAGDGARQGLALTRRVKALPWLHDVPVLLLCDPAGEGSSRAHAAGADAWLPLPVDVRRVPLVVTALLASEGEARYA